jgi:hypothetical protein
VPASNPESTPKEKAPLLQFGLPAAQGIAIVPLETSLKMQVAAGGPLVLQDEPPCAVNSG